MSKDNDSNVRPWASRIPRPIQSSGCPQPESAIAAMAELSLSELLPKTTGTLRSGPSQGSFFESSNNVKIPGAQFTSAQNITINYNHQTKIEDHRQELPQPSDLRDSDGDQDIDVGSSQQKQRLSETGSQPSPPLPIQTSPEIYNRHLATKGRGYPLWIPEPNNMLPAEYQKKGIGIGDVGIITHYGAFDFLFNICVPRSDSINPKEMPEDFSPLTPPLGLRDIRGFAAFKANSHLASTKVETSQRDQESPLTFKSSASEGAILTMPNGSNAKELRNVISFKKYASANAEKWYKYVRGVCGHEARNGDVRLVVGYDTTTAWGMATFANLSEHGTFRLKFKPVGENSLGRIYGWEYSGMAEVKSGPDMNEVEKLRDLDHAEDLVSYENQCLFVQTINITLRDNIWDRLVAESEKLNLGDEALPPNHNSQSPVASSNGYQSRSGLGNRGGTSDDMRDGMDVTPPVRQRQSQAVHLSNLPQAFDDHPSKGINEMLLRKYPNTKMAITEDRDWMSVIEENDAVVPHPEVLFSRMMAKHDIREEEGAIFLQLKRQSNFAESRNVPLRKVRVARSNETTSTIAHPNVSVYPNTSAPSTYSTNFTEEESSTKPVTPRVSRTTPTLSAIISGVSAISSYLTTSGHPAPSHPLASSSCPDLGEHSSTSSYSRTQSDADESDGYNSDPGDDASSVVELDPDDFPAFFSERDGRLFPASSSPYPLPVDTPEQERLNLLHNLLRLFLGANYVGPVAELFRDPDRNMALDVCTGNGMWVMEMAQEFPHVRFRAFDIVPIATRYPHENVQFEVEDINTDFRWSDATFDLVHARAIVMAVRNYSQTLREIGRVLRPGGLFLSCEWWPYPAFDPSLQVARDLETHAPASYRFYSTLNAALLQSRGLQPISDQVLTLLEAAGGFEQISSTQYCIPIGAWSTDPFLRSIGLMCLDATVRYGDSVKPLLIEFGWSEGDINKLFVDFIREIRTVNGLVSVLYIVHARKAQT